MHRIDRIFFGDGGGAYFMDYDGADKMLIPLIK